MLEKVRCFLKTNKANVATFGGCFMIGVIIAKIADINYTEGAKKGTENLLKALLVKETNN